MDLISRQVAIEALQGLVSRFEQILRDIRETKIDDSVCGMCEYDGAYMGQSGDWCNECPGFDKDDCFKLSEECKKRWLDSVELPSAQPECKQECMPMYANVCDYISRRAALEAMDTWDKFGCDPDGKLVRYDDDKHYVPYVHYEDMVHAIKHLPSAQPETHEERTETHERDLIDRQAAIDALKKAYWDKNIQSAKDDPCIVDAMTDWAIRQIKDLPSAQPQSTKLDEWCDDCAEYDKTTHSCPRFNRVIRETLDDVRKEAYKHGKSKGIKRGMAIAKRKHEE